MQPYNFSYVSLNALPSTSYARQDPTPNDVHAAPTPHEHSLTPCDAYAPSPYAPQQQAAWQPTPSLPYAPHVATPSDMLLGTPYGEPDGLFSVADANFWAACLPPTPNAYGGAPTPVEPDVRHPSLSFPLDADHLAVALQPYAHPSSSGYLTPNDAMPDLTRVNVRSAPEVFGGPRLTFPIAPPPSALPSSSSSEASLSTRLSMSSIAAISTATSLASLASRNSFKSQTPASVFSTWNQTPAKRQEAAVAHTLSVWGYDAAMVDAVQGGAQGAAWLVQHVAELHGWGFAPATVTQLLAQQSAATMTCLLAYTPALLVAGLSTARIVQLVETAGANALVGAVAYAPLLTGQGMTHETFLRLMLSNPGTPLLAAVALAAPTTRALGLDPDDLVSVALGPNGEAGVLALAECGPDLVRRGALASQLATSLRLAGGAAKVREIFRASYVPVAPPKPNKGKRKASFEYAAPPARQRLG